MTERCPEKVPWIGTSLIQCVMSDEYHPTHVALGPILEGSTPPLKLEFVMVKWDKFSPPRVIELPDPIIQFLVEMEDRWHA